MAQTTQKRICYLMAVYNDPQAVLRTLDSLYADAPLADIVIIDDGSDVPLTKPDAPNGFSVMVIRAAQNGGIAKALNRGLQTIRAFPYEYIARIDAGDRVVPGRLAAQSAYLDAHPEVGVVGAQMEAIDPQTGETLFHIVNPIDPMLHLSLRNTLAHPTAMIRLKAIQECGLYDPNFVYAEDYELWHRIAQRYKLANLPDVWVKKEVTPTQITSAKRYQTRASRLRVQMKYFKALSIYSWLGVARSLLSFCVPMPLWRALKGREKMLVSSPVKR